MTNLSPFEIINFLFSGCGVAIGSWLLARLRKQSIPDKGVSPLDFLQLKIKRFFAIWIIILSFLSIIYIIFFSHRSHIFPELGLSFSHKWGNTVEWYKIEDKTLKIKFSSLSKNHQDSGGIFYTNFFTLLRRAFPFLSNFSIFQDTQINGAKKLHIRIRGRLGNEKIEIKLRNHRGEGWYIIGNPDNRISKEYHDITVPISNFERSEETAMGAAFDHREGLDAIVFGYSSQIGGPSSAEIHIKKVFITPNKRNDTKAVFLLLFLVFILSSTYSIIIFLIDWFKIKRRIEPSH